MRDLFRRFSCGLVLTLLCVQLDCSWALGQGIEISESNVNMLRSRLVSEVNLEQLDAVIELGYIGPYARSAVLDIVEVMRDDNPQLQYECIVALGKIGPLAHEAANSLTRFLESESVLHQSAALESLRQIGVASPDAESEIRRLCSHSDAAIATSAIRCLLMLTDENNDTVRQSVPRLLRALGDDRSEVRNEAAVTLSEIGTSIVPDVTKALSDSDKRVRLKACSILGQVGPAAADSTPALVVRLHDDTELVVRAAAEALGLIHSHPEVVLPALVALLKNQSVPLQITGARAIGDFGPTAKNLAPLMISQLADSKIMLRVAAAEALGKIGDNSPSVIDELVKALSDFNGTVTVRAANSLSQIGAPAVPALVKMLSNENYRKLVVEVIGEMGENAESAVPALLPLLETFDTDLKREVFIALAMIGPKASSATATMMQILENPDAGESRAGAAYVLAHIGEKKALPVLKQILKTDRSEQVLRSAAWSIVELEPENPDNAAIVLPQFFPAMSSDTPLERREAILAISKLGVAAKSAIEDLQLHAASDDDPTVRAAALHGLTETHAFASQSLAVAVASLRDANPAVRNAARYLLGRLGMEAQSTAPLLRESLRHGDPMERIVSAWALVHVEPTPEYIHVAIPVLLTGLRYPDPRVRTESAIAIGVSGSASTEVLTELEAAKHDSDDGVKQAATSALARLHYGR